MEQLDRVDRYGKTVLIGIAWSASAGGIGTIIGTPALTLALSLYEEEFPTAPTISFAKWMGFGFPVSIVVTLLAWFLLTRWFMKESFSIDQDIMRKQYNSLSAMNRDEKVVLGTLCINIYQVLHVTEEFNCCKYFFGSHDRICFNHGMDFAPTRNMIVKILAKTLETLGKNIWMTARLQLWYPK